MRNKDYCPRPNTLLHRQIKEIVEQDIKELMSKINQEEFFNELLRRSKHNKKEIDIEAKISKLEIRKDKLYQLTKKVYNDALNEIIDIDTSSKMIKEYQEEQKKIASEIETLKNLKKEEESTIENYKLLKEKVNEFLEFKEIDSLIVHSLISRIEVGYRDNPRTIKIYYKFIDDSISN
jgi:site-specific recombinases, DNA invertase pin homologs